MNINQLIKDITTLYNKYKSTSKIISGNESLEIMWDIGDFLKQFINRHDIAPHKLYREVYGKSEGKANISRTTWITREFQGRCYRIHNIFSSKRDIDKIFPTLKSFTLFREAMPFFAVDREGVVADKPGIVGIHSQLGIGIDLAIELGDEKGIALVDRDDRWSD